MAQFVKVSALPCNSSGQSTGQTQRQNLVINTDLIAALRGNTIYIKGAIVVQFGDTFYTKFELSNPQSIQGI